MASGSSGQEILESYGSSSCGSVNSSAPLESNEGMRTRLLQLPNCPILHVHGMHLAPEPAADQRGRRLHSKSEQHVVGLTARCLFGSSLRAWPGNQRASRPLRHLGQRSDACVSRWSPRPTRRSLDTSVSNALRTQRKGGIARLLNMAFPCFPCPNPSKS